MGLTKHFPGKHQCRLDYDNLSNFSLSYWTNITLFIDLSSQSKQEQEIRNFLPFPKKDVTIRPYFMEKEPCILHFVEFCPHWGDTPPQSPPNPPSSHIPTKPTECSIFQKHTGNQKGPSARLLSQFWLPNVIILGVKKQLLKESTSPQVEKRTTFSML